MTAMEVNTQIWRDIAEIADNESLMKQLAKYLKKLTAKKKAEAFGESDPPEASSEQQTDHQDRQPQMAVASCSCIR